MGVDDNGPPKKKLKQAQLPFCVLAAEKVRNKRKLNEDSPLENAQVVKLLRQDNTPTSKSHVANKENLKLNSAAPTVVEQVDLTLDSDTEGAVTAEGADVEMNAKGGSSAKHISSCETKSQDSEVECVLNETSKVDNNKSNTLQSENPPSITVADSEVAPLSKDLENHSPDEKIIAENYVEITKSNTIVNQDSSSKDEPLKDSKDSPEVSETSVEMKEAVLVKPVSSDVSANLLSTPKHKKPVSCIGTPEPVLESGGKINTPPSLKTKGDISNESSTTDVNSSVLVTDSDEPSAADTPAKEKLPLTPKEKLPLTPKQKAVQLKRQQRREQKLKLRKEKEDLMRQKLEEKKKKKLEEQELRDRERNQKIEQRKKKEQAKEDEKKRKEEERRKKEEAKEDEKSKKKMKEDERRRKEEMKEEDRRKKEEAKLAEERKENLIKEAFSKFFIPTKPKPSLNESIETENQQEPTEKIKFMPFPLKTDMKLAVVVRHSLSQEEKENLTKYLDPSADQPPAKLYLETIKSGERKPMKTPATWPVSEEQHDVIIVETEVEETLGKSEKVKLRGKLMQNRAKLLKFHENRRPPYWGTWGKKSTNVTPRNPFGKDKLFDYEVDSDSEWEDEEEGEDIEKEADSDKEQSDDENVGDHGYVLDKTFVPHGYLSDEEAAKEDEDESSSDPEDQKLKLNLLKREFDQDLKSKTQRLKPRLLGLVIVPNDVTEVSPGSLYETIVKYRCVWDEANGPLDPLAPATQESPPPTPSAAVSKFVPAVMEPLVKLIHGNRTSHQNLVTEFMSLLENDKKLPHLSKRSVKIKIKEIARKVLDTTGKMVWKVNAELCKEYNLPEIVVPTQSVSSTATPHSSPAVEASPKMKETPLTNFLAKASPQEPKKRVTPILVSPLVRKPSVSTEQNSASNNRPTTPKTEPPIRKRIVPITLSKTVSFTLNSSENNIFTTPVRNFPVSDENPKLGKPESDP